jgi:hypothetical protein
MKTIPQDIIYKRFEEISDELFDFLSSEGIADLIDRISKKYKLTEDQGIYFSKLIAFYCLKLITNQEFVDEIGEIVDKKYFDSFIKELEEKIWAPYNVLLDKEGIFYKQLSKLKPRPVIKDLTPVKETKEETVLELDKIAGVEEKEKTGIPKPNIETVAQPLELEINQTAIAASESKPQNILETEPLKQEEISETTLETYRTIPEKEVKIPQPNYQTQARVFVSPTEQQIKIEEQIPETQNIEFQTVKFEKPSKTSEIKQEIISSKKPTEIEIPKPPEIPKTVISGKEVIDLSNLNVLDNNQK